VAKEHKRRIWGILIFALFAFYFFAAARPIPLETVLAPQWAASLESGETLTLAAGRTQEAGELIPFTLGGRFGYVSASGRFQVNREKTGEIYLGQNYWVEYEAEPAVLEINNLNSGGFTIDNPRGYPFILDGRIFLLGSEQNSISEADANGNILWTYEFGASLTCVDAAAGLLLTGSIDGVIEVINSEGSRIFYFEPGGSRYGIILGCALSKDGQRLGVICGVEDQRFLLLEQYGIGDYKVIYHEFLGSGFRRPVHITFVDQDRWIVFEREEGIGCYEIKNRQSIKVPLNGRISAIDHFGGQGLLFLVVSRPYQLNDLIGIRLPEGRLNSGPETALMPENIIISAPFKSAVVFLERRGSRLFVGGGAAIAAFDLEKK
jgi:hypothetical protein